MAQAAVVERAGEAEVDRRVVGAALEAHAVEKPEALLGVAEWKRGGARDGDERGTGFGFAVRLQPIRDLRHAGALEDELERQLDAGGATDARDERGGHQAVAADLEEVIVGRDGL